MKGFAEATGSVSRFGAPVLNSIAACVDSKAICLQMSATDWLDVVGLLSCRLLACGNVKPGFVHSVIMREQARPTGVRFRNDLCVALPRTDPALVVRPSLAIATLARPVLFGGIRDPDAKVPVRLVILAASTSRTGQIQTLRSVAGMFQGGRTLEHLVRAHSIAYVTATICNSRDVYGFEPTTGQLADDLAFAR
jgi:galactitol PTS system EIIA component